MTAFFTKLRQYSLRGIFSLFGYIPSEWRSRLQNSFLHGFYLRIISPLSRGLGEYEFVISDGPLTGYKVMLSPDRWERRYLFGEYEPEIVGVIMQYCKPGMITLDIGANLGYFSLMMAKAIGQSGRCLAFEPFPENSEKIRYALSANSIKNLDVYDVAIGDYDGTAEFAVESSGFMGHVVGKGGADFQATQIFNVPVATLDTILDKLAVGQVGLMKIDVEGAEGAVIEGARQRLISDRPILIVEVHTFLPPSQHAQPFVRRLTELDYHVKDIHTMLEVEPEGYEGGHIIAIPR